jgi:hypothetical protein
MLSKVNFSSSYTPEKLKSRISRSCFSFTTIIEFRLVSSCHVEHWWRVLLDGLGERNGSMPANIRVTLATSTNSSNWQYDYWTNSHSFCYSFDCSTVSERVLRWYSKCYSVESITKTFLLQPTTWTDCTNRGIKKKKGVRNVERWTFCTPSSLNVFVTVATQ